MRNKKNLIIIDGTALAFRTSFAIKDIFSTKDGESRTEIIYGFLRQLLSIKKFFPIQKYCDVVFVWDGKNNKKPRAELYPEYKKPREKKQDIDYSVFEQMNDLRKYVLPDMGFCNQFIQEEREADDIIAKLVYDNESDYNITIVANDKDLYQLLSNNVNICNISFKKNKIYTYKDFQKEYMGITSGEWINVKMLAGCVSDNIKGIRGVGEKTACKFIMKKFPKTHKTYEKIMSKEGKEIQRRNYPLVKIPFEGTKEFKIKSDNLTVINFREIFDLWDFDSFLEDRTWSEWSMYFNLK